jgi:hypothetical protein
MRNQSSKVPLPIRDPQVSAQLLDSKARRALNSASTIFTYLQRKKHEISERA